MNVQCKEQRATQDYQIPFLDRAERTVYTQVIQTYHCEKNPKKHIDTGFLLEQKQAYNRHEYNVYRIDEARLACRRAYQTYLYQNRT